MAQQIVLS